MRTSSLALAAGVFTTITFAQTFEVAAIRPAEMPNVAALQAALQSGKGLPSVGLKIDGTRVSYGMTSLRDLIVAAYEVKPFQVVGPDWMTQQRFDINAIVAEGTTKEKIPAMLRALLEERFKLKAHRENKDQDVYALTVGKDGPKMKPAPEAAPAAPPAPAAKGETVLGNGDQQIRITQPTAGGQGQVSMSTPETGNVKITPVGGGPGAGIESMMVKMEMERLTMPALVDQLTTMMDLPVVDRTGLAGAFQVSLTLAIMDVIQAASKVGAAIPGLPAGLGAGAAGAGPAGLSAAPAGASIFSSVQQLGLRLDKQKAPVSRVIVDSVEKAPTDN